MILAAMIASGEDDFICDMAEVYHVFDWRGLPLRLAATLAAGLPQDCRVRRKMSGLKVPVNTMLLALISDCLSRLCWWQTKDGQSGHNPPPSMLETLCGEQKKEKYRTFKSGDEFMDYYNSVVMGGE